MFWGCPRALWDSSAVGLGVHMDIVGLAVLWGRGCPRVVWDSSAVVGWWAGGQTWWDALSGCSWPLSPQVAPARRLERTQAFGKVGRKPAPHAPPGARSAKAGGGAWR